MCIRVGVTPGLLTDVVIITPVSEPGPGHREGDGPLGTSWRDKYPRHDFD